MNLVVVSNRVARGKPNEPMTGGLAAALLGLEGAVVAAMHTTTS